MNAIMLKLNNIFILFLALCGCAQVTEEESMDLSPYEEEHAILIGDVIANAKEHYECQHQAGGASISLCLMPALEIPQQEVVFLSENQHAHVTIKNRGDGNLRIDNMLWSVPSVIVPANAESQRYFDAFAQHKRIYIAPEYAMELELMIAPSHNTFHGENLLSIKNNDPQSANESMTFVVPE